MSITGKTQVYAILGNPVEHSFSPVIQNAAFIEKDLDAVYVAFEVKDLKKSVDGIRALDIKGCSVTIPFKIDIIPLLDQVDPLAKNIGAVNTVLNQDGKLIGYNTDGIGALRAIKELEPLNGKRIAIIGFGGAARAIGFTLTAEKPESIIIWGLKDKAGEKLAEEITSKTEIKSDFINLDKQVEYDILINATPVGMWPDEDAMPIHQDFVIPKSTVFDIIYNPKETKLLKIAKKKDCWVLHGYKMLLYQGVEQFRIWTNGIPPIDVMEEALLSYL